MVKFLSWNVRGLREDRKRKEMFTFLQNKAFDIIFIQESHSSPEIEKKWQDEWGGIIQDSHYNSNNYNYNNKDTCIIMQEVL